MLHSVSCKAHAYNAGNVYNFPATSASSAEPATRSVCPKGWYLPDKTKETDYSHLIIEYGIDNSATTKSNYDSGLVNLPLSFLRSGFCFNGTLYDQGNLGYYRMTSQVLRFNSVRLYPTYDTNTYYGYSVRCVGR